jgi:hypothetical protein
LTNDLALADELQTIRKGRGLMEPKLADRTGPILQGLIKANIDSLNGSSDPLSHGQVRLALTDMLLAATPTLPVDLQETVNVMFVTEPEKPSYPTLTERQQDLADRLRLEIRAIRRRCDGALQLLAESLSRGATLGSQQARATPDKAEAERQRRERLFVAGTWHTEKFSVILRLDSDPITCREERTIVASADGVSQLTASTGLLIDQAGTGRPVHTEIEYGGRYISAQTHPGGVTVVHLQISRTLYKGDRYNYGRTLRLDEAGRQQPKYLFTPGVDCDEFVLRVRFNEHELPVKIWEYAGVPYKVADADAPGPDTTELDSIGEAYARFTGLHRGSAYGLGWSWGGPHASN